MHFQNATIIEMMNLYRDALDNGDRVVKEWREMDIAQMDWLQYLNYDWTSPYESKFPQEQISHKQLKLSESFTHILPEFYFRIT